MWLMPPPLPVSDVTGELSLMFVVVLLFVFAVLAVLVARAISRPRRTIRTVTCPERRRPALIVVTRTWQGARVADCSRWHDRPLDCGGRCLDRRTGTDG